MADAGQQKVTDGVCRDSIDRTGRYWSRYGGTGSLGATADSVTVYIPADADYLSQPQLTRLGSAAATAADGPLVLGGVTVNGDGSLTPTTKGQVTVYRTAHADGAINFSFSTHWR